MAKSSWVTKSANAFNFQEIKRLWYRHNGKKQSLQSPLLGAHNPDYAPVKFWACKHWGKLKRSYTRQKSICTQNGHSKFTERIFGSTLNKKTWIIQHHCISELIHNNSRLVENSSLIANLAIDFQILGAKAVEKLVSLPPVRGTISCPDQFIRKRRHI